jgi:hypothetical protein
VGLDLIQILVLRPELSKVLRAAEGVQIDEHRVALHLAGVLDPQVVGVGVHGHDLLLDVLRLLRQIDAVAQALAHLGLAVNAGQAQAGSILGQNDLRLHQRVAVHGVELVHDLAALLDHGLLVLTGGHRGGLEGGDIGRLADGVAEEAHRDAGLEVAHLDLALHGGVALQAAHGDQIHIIEAQFRQLRHHGLDKDVGLGRVDAAGQVVQCHLQDVLAHLFRVVGVVGQGLCVGDHHIDLIVLAGVLQAHALLQGADVVAHMQTSGRAVARQNHFFHGFLLLNGNSLRQALTGLPAPSGREPCLLSHLR